MADIKEDGPEIGAGNVTVELGGKECVLVSTPGAALQVSRMTGGLRGAVEAVMRLDLDVIAKIVQFGLGPKAVKELGGNDKIPTLVVEAGVVDGAGCAGSKIVEYVGLLSNGGRPPRAAGEDDPPR